VSGALISFFTFPIMPATGTGRERARRSRLSGRRGEIQLPGRGEGGTVRRMDIEWRSLTEKDVPAWGELLRAAEEVDQEDEHYNEEDLVEELADPLFDVERGTLAGFEGAAMVALGRLRARSGADAVHKMAYQGVVHPARRGRGLGTRLLTWAPDVAQVLHAELFPESRLELNTGHISTNMQAGDLFVRHGYRPTRYYHGMRRDLGPDLSPVADVHGIDIVGYSAERDEEALRVKNEAFLDHWGSTPWTPEQWQNVYSQSVSFRPDLSFLAVDGASGRVVGVILTKYYEADTAANGRRDAYIAVVGTQRAARGRGVAGALMSTAMHAARAAGFDTASLGVDSQNPTGALGVYERAGLTVKDTWINYSQEF
jgi:mycothiol synthase